MKRLISVAAIGFAGLAIAVCGSSSKSSSTPTTNASSPTSASSPSSPSTPSSSSVSTGNPTSVATLNESGSSLLYPFLQELVSPLRAAYSNIILAPAAGGSGKGISDAIAGTVQMGGSDAYLSPGQRAANPSLQNVPIAVSSQAVNYNLPGVPNLKLSGDVLAQIVSGQDHQWNDSAISSLNPASPFPPPRSSRCAGWTDRVTRSSSPASSPPPIRPGRTGPASGPR